MERSTEKALRLAENTWADTNGQLARMAEAMGQDEFAMLVSLARKANRVLEANRGENDQRRNACFV